MGVGSIGVGFGSIDVGFGFRTGGNIAVGLGLAGCPAGGDTGEAEGVGGLCGAGVREALAGVCFFHGASGTKKDSPRPRTDSKRRFA